MPSDELDALREICKGMFYPSESDAPFEVFVWRYAGADPVQQIAAHTGKRGKVQEVSLNDFFAELESSEDGARFKQLHQTLLATLGAIRVLRIGDVEVDIFLIGKDRSGNWAGLRTVSVET